jgi:hypothetical protein
MNIKDKRRIAAAIQLLARVFDNKYDSRSKKSMVEEAIKELKLTDYKQKEVLSKSTPS